MNLMLDAALSYARAGYSVLPLRGKIPLTEHGSHDATTDEETIRSWWARWPSANIGMTLNGLVVVDIDPRNGGDLACLPHPLPDTCRAHTGGGGLHYVFRAQPGSAYPAALANGVDQKSGPFSYIVVAPSTHASGAQYMWLSNDPRTTQPAPAPEWLSHPRNFIRTTPSVRHLSAHRPSRSCGEGWTVIDQDDNPTEEQLFFNRKAARPLA